MSRVQKNTRGIELGGGGGWGWNCKNKLSDFVNKEQRNSVAVEGGYGNEEGSLFCFCFKISGHIYLHLIRECPHLWI